MIFEKFDTYPTEKLSRRGVLSTFALCTVWVGAAVALLAGAYRLIESGGEIGLTTVAVSMLALLASIPAWVERQKIYKTLALRTA